MNAVEDPKLRATSAIHLPAGYRLRAVIDAGPRGYVVRLVKAPARAPYAEQTAWIDHAGAVTWDVTIDRLGYVVDSEGRRID